jgi:hypothetical protein
VRGGIVDFTEPEGAVRAAIERGDIYEEHLTLPPFTGEGAEGGWGLGVMLRYKSVSRYARVTFL